MIGICQLVLLSLLIGKSDNSAIIHVSTDLTDGSSFECDSSAVLSCSLSQFTGTMTWEVNTIPQAQCVFGSCTANSPLSGNYTFSFDQANKIFNMTINPVSFTDDGKSIVCSDGSFSATIRGTVKVVPINSSVVYTNTSTTNGVDIILTTGCANPANVGITWYYRKDVTGASRELYTKTSPVTVTVTDATCQSGNCSFATAAKKRSTLSIKTSSTGGNQYVFEAFIKHPDARGYFFDVGTYILAGTSDTSPTTTATTTPATASTATTSTTTTTTTTSTTTASITATATTAKPSNSTPTSSFHALSSSTSMTTTTKRLSTTTEGSTGIVAKVVPSVVVPLVVIVVLGIVIAVWKKLRHKGRENNSLQHHTNIDSKTYQQKRKHAYEIPLNTYYPASRRFQHGYLHALNPDQGQSQIWKNPLYVESQYSYVPQFNPVHGNYMSRRDAFYPTWPEYRSHRPKLVLRADNNVIAMDYSKNWY